MSQQTEPRTPEEWYRFCTSRQALKGKRRHSDTGLCLDCAYAYRLQGITEALAHVAVILEDCHGHHTDDYDRLADCPICVNQNVPARARALLDVVEAALKIKWEADFEDDPWRVFRPHGQALQDALARLSQGRAKDMG